ncbi:MAG: hypothetical protein KBF88_10510 [Polyangiaceae bacterium]|nr:hypothetical protein [Polyangiaceae bacterium]
MLWTFLMNADTTFVPRMTKALKLRAKTKEPLPALPSVARTDIIDSVTRSYFESEVTDALKRRPTYEPALAGALRALAVWSPGLRDCLVDVVSTLGARKSYDRPLWSGAVRALAELGDARVVDAVRTALLEEGAGGPATLSAACFIADPKLAPVLQKLSATRGQSYLAFHTELARVIRGESTGPLLTSLAPMIKETHRLSLCSDAFFPLLRAKPLPLSVAPALAVLRSAERHLGRWLVLADLGRRAGDVGPLEEAKKQRDAGLSSSRAAWGLVVWALEGAALDSETPAQIPGFAKTNFETLARLSDRPSAEKDLTFLFRVAAGKVNDARSLLEIVKNGEVPEKGTRVAKGDKGTEAKAEPAPPPAERTLASLENGVRSAFHLGSAFEDSSASEWIKNLAASTKQDELAAFAAASLWDLGDRDVARELADKSVHARTPAAMAWGALVRAFDDRKKTFGDRALFTETNIRWIQRGACE